MYSLFFGTKINLLGFTTTSMSFALGAKDLPFWFKKLDPQMDLGSKVHLPEPGNALSEMLLNCLGSWDRPETWCTACSSD